MSTWKIDLVGGIDNASWHGTVEATDAYSAKIAGRDAATAAGWRPSRHSEVYVTHIS